MNIKFIDEELVLLDYPSETDPNISYQVNKWGGLWGCNCPDFMFRSGDIDSGYECKHIHNAISHLVNSGVVNE